MASMTSSTLAMTERPSRRCLDPVSRQGSLLATVEIQRDEVPCLSNPHRKKALQRLTLTILIALAVRRDLAIQAEDNHVPYAPGGRSTKREKWPWKPTVRVSVGPLRCLAMMRSASPARGLSFS